MHSLGPDQCAAISSPTRSLAHRPDGYGQTVVLPTFNHTSGRASAGCRSPYDICQTPLISIVACDRGGERGCSARIAFPGRVGGGGFMRRFGLFRIGRGFLGGIGIGLGGGRRGLLGLVLGLLRFLHGIFGPGVADGLDVGVGDGEEVILGLPIDGPASQRRIEEVKDRRGDLGLEPQELVAMEGRGIEFDLVESGAFNEGPAGLDGVLRGIVVLAGDEEQGDARGDGGDGVAEHIAGALGHGGDQGQGAEVAGTSLGGDGRAGMERPGRREVRPVAQGDHAQLGQVQLAPVVAVDQEEIGGLQVLDEARPLVRGSGLGERSGPARAGPGSGRRS